MTDKEKAFIEERIKHYRCLSYDCMCDAACSDNPDIREGSYDQSRLFDERADCLVLLLKQLSFLSPS